MRNLIWLSILVALLAGCGTAPAPKQNLTLYIMAGNKESGALLDKLGKHTSSGGCLYLKRLSDVDQKVLVKLIKNSYQYMKKSTKPE